MDTPIANRLTEKLTVALAPTHLEVINESHNHHVPANSETHFKVVIVSNAFEGQRLIARHRAVNGALMDEFEQGLHALTMHTYTLDEWQALDAVPESPKCKG